MKRKAHTESDKFDSMMDGLLAVPYKELQQKIVAEKKAKARLPKRSGGALRMKRKNKTKNEAKGAVPFEDLCRLDLLLRCLSQDATEEFDHVRAS